jgi:hypothetical protein
MMDGRTYGEKDGKVANVANVIPYVIYVTSLL